MHYATYLYEGNECAGVVSNEGFYPFKALFGKDMTMLEFIREHESINLGKLPLDQHSPIPQAKLTPLAPIPRPFRHVICLGKNYEDHAKEVMETIQSNQNANLIPQAPIYFTKTACPAIGDGGTVSVHSNVTQKADYEAELAVIIGKTASRISRQDAESVIFGYTIVNDLTARDLQAKHSQWFFGKSLDGFCPMGPVIVSRDEIPFPVELEIKCRVNCEQRQSSNTSYLIFDIPHVISELSQGITLHPGDIIATGTPAGIGHAMKPAQYLKAGDVVECEIEKIGVLTTRFGH